MVTIKRADISHLSYALSIYNDAIKKFEIEKTYQWTKGYPNEDIFKQDLIENQVYVADLNGKIVGIMTILLQEELDYREIDGKWLNDEKYITIHRIAVKQEFLGKGIGSSLIDYAIKFVTESGINNIRIDTHEFNYDMKKLLLRKGFIKCGVIKLRNKNFELRDAYHYSNKHIN